MINSSLRFAVSEVIWAAVIGGAGAIVAALLSRTRSRRNPNTSNGVGIGDRTIQPFAVGNTVLSVTILVILIMFSSPIPESINPHTFGDFAKLRPSHTVPDEEASAVINDSAGGDNKRVGRHLWKRGDVAYVDEEEPIEIVYVNNTDPPERRECVLERKGKLTIVGFSPVRSEALIQYTAPNEQRAWTKCETNTHFFYPL